MDCQIVPLSRELLRAHLEEILVMDRGIIGEPWQSEHYLAELPGKWQYSCLALQGSTALGGVVASLKASGLHLHRVVVGAAYQGHGIGTRLVHHVACSAVENDIPLLTLKVAVANARAIKLYRRLGFEQDGATAENLTLSIMPRTLCDNALENLLPDMRNA